MSEELVETWEINNRITLYLLDAVDAEALVQPPAKGRSVGEQFAHIHNVRIMWLKAAAPDLANDLDKIEKEAAGDRAVLRTALLESGAAISGLLRRALAEGGRVKGFKPHATAFLGYLISHDSYHRAEVGLILSQIGHPLDKTVSYGMWEWGTR